MASHNQGVPQRAPFDLVSYDTWSPNLERFPKGPTTSNELYLPSINPTSLYQLSAGTTHTGLLSSPDQQVNIPQLNTYPTWSRTHDGVNAMANQSDQQTSNDIPDQVLELNVESEPHEQDEDAGITSASW